MATTGGANVAGQYRGVTALIAAVTIIAIVAGAWMVASLSLPNLYRDGGAGCPPAISSWAGVLQEAAVPASIACPADGARAAATGGTLLDGDYVPPPWSVRGWLAASFMEEEYAAAFARGGVVTAAQVAALQDLDLAFLGVRRGHLALLRLMVASLRASCGGGGWGPAPSLPVHLGAGATAEDDEQAAGVGVRDGVLAVSGARSNDRRQGHDGSDDAVADRLLQSDVGGNPVRHTLWSGDILYTCDVPFGNTYREAHATDFYRGWASAKEQQGPKALALLKSVLDMVGLPFYFEGGTGLGLIRNCGIIPGDPDTDISIPAFFMTPAKHAELERLLPLHRMRLRKQFGTSGRVGHELTIKYASRLTTCVLLGTRAGHPRADTASLLPRRHRAGTSTTRTRTQTCF